MTQSQQSVRSNGQQTHVTQSAAGDGRVERRVERTADGVHASQQVTTTESGDTVDRSREHQVKKRVKDGAKYTRKVKKTKDGTTIIVIIKPGDNTPPQNQTPDTPPADGNETAPPPVNGTPESPSPPGPTFPENDTDNGTDGADGNGSVDEPPTNLTDPNGSDIGGNGASGITNLTPPGGARLLGDQYQTPPNPTPEEPPEDVERLGLLERILLFLRGILAAVLNWFARLGTL